MIPKKWKYYIAYFCVPINVFLIGFGILINDMMLALMAFASCGLVLLPIYQEKHAVRLEKEKPTKSKNQRPLP